MTRFTEAELRRKTHSELYKLKARLYGIEREDMLRSEDSLIRQILEVQAAQGGTRNG